MDVTTKIKTVFIVGMLALVLNVAFVVKATLQVNVVAAVGSWQLFKV